MADLNDVAVGLSKLPPHRHPLHNRAVMSKLAVTHPASHALVQQIASNPQLRAVAMGSGGATGADPTGTNLAGTGPNSSLGFGNAMAIRNSRVRHLILGFTALSLGATGSGVAKATPNVEYKVNKLAAVPSVLFAGTIQQIQSGVKPQYVSLAAEDLDMYQPLSYGGEIDLDPVKAAVPINATITAANGGTATFYGALIGVAVGIQYREMTSKLMAGSLGSSGSVSANGTGSLVLTPQIGYTTRKVLFTPGSAFSDYFVITSITAGVQNQLMSPDPIPASVFNDLYPLFIDFDRVTAAVPLTVNYQNVAASAGTLKGSTRGDVDQADLVRFSGMDVTG